MADTPQKPAEILEALRHNAAELARSTQQDATDLKTAGPELAELAELAQKVSEAALTLSQDRTAPQP